MNEKQRTESRTYPWVSNWYCGRMRLSITGIESRALELPRHAGLWAYEYRSADTPLVPDSSTGIVLSIRVVALEKVSKYSVVLTHGDPRSYFEFMSEAHDILSDDATHVSVNLEQLNRLDHILGAGYKDAKVFRCFVECLRFMVHGVDSDTDDLHDPKKKVHRTIQMR